MADWICNTSPIQYLHQLGQLDLLRTLATAVFVPPAVANELLNGMGLGIDLPDLKTAPWISVHAIQSNVPPQWKNKLGPGKAEVLQLAPEMPGSCVILDDRIARTFADEFKLPFKGTLGILLDAKRAGLLAAVRPFIDQLNGLGFRLAPATRAHVPRLAGEPTS
ncbi:MAG TPA: DUF3368 domain-containing protein [Pirellulales bacterium]|nr:DUF3368 domain-containing protein [Pirellulales bacterium]